MTDKHDNEPSEGAPESEPGQNQAPENGNGRGPTPGPQTVAPAAGGAGAQGLAIAALVLAVIALVVTLFGGWWGWQRYQAFADSQAALVDEQALEAQAEVLNQRLSELRGRVTSLDERTAGRDQQIAELKEAIAGVRQQQSDLTARMDRVTELAQVSRDDWRRSEAAYLARVAVHRLRYYQDVDAALGALKEADSLLAALGGEVVAERKAIRKALDRLLAAKQPDIGSIAAELGRLAEGVGGYGLRTGADPAQLDAATTPDDGLAIPGAVDEAWEQFRGAIGELVVVSGPERDVVPLLPVEQRYFLRENLRLRLEAARIAALQGHTSVYRDSLELAQRWLETYFDREDSAVAEASTRLDELLGRSVEAELPTIEAVLAPVREFD